jgi:hypothetical protein
MAPGPYIRGGALANLLFAAALFMLIAFLDERSSEWIRTFALPAIAGFALSNIGVAILALWPHAAGFDQDSDGAQILALFHVRQRPDTVEDPRTPLLLAGQRLTLAGRFTEAADLFAAKLKEWPNDPYLLGMLIHCTARATCDKVALARYAAWVAAAPAGPPRGFDWHLTMTGWLAANIAWSTIKSGPDADLEIADAELQTALALLPDAPEVKATFGALQVVRGETISGERLLTDALRKALAPNDRADFSLYIAKARQDRGDTNGAAEAEKLREHILARALERPVI